MRRYTTWKIGQYLMKYDENLLAVLRLMLYNVYTTYATMNHLAELVHSPVSFNLPILF